MKPDALLSTLDPARCELSVPAHMQGSNGADSRSEGPMYLSVPASSLCRLGVKERVGWQRIYVLEKGVHEDQHLFCDGMAWTRNALDVSMAHRRGLAQGGGGD